MRQVQTNGGESGDSIKTCHGSFRSVRSLRLISTLCSLESFKQNIHIHLTISETKNRLGVVLVYYLFDWCIWHSLTFKLIFWSIIPTLQWLVSKILFAEHETRYFFATNNFYSILPNQNLVLRHIYCALVLLHILFICDNFYILLNQDFVRIFCIV